MVPISYSNFLKKSTNLSRTILVYFKKAKQLSYKPTKKIQLLISKLSCFKIWDLLFKYFVKRPSEVIFNFRILKENIIYDNKIFLQRYLEKIMANSIEQHKNLPNLKNLVKILKKNKRGISAFEKHILLTTLSNVQKSSHYHITYLSLLIMTNFKTRVLIPLFFTMLETKNRFVIFFIKYLIGKSNKYSKYLLKLTRYAINNYRLEKDIGGHGANNFMKKLEKDLQILNLS
mmetsp:Transcript_2376/g.4355  ORF Transcript_2376/g.4355 Transcript_2376/m.4355 type:complete len:231 (-) Transcript_2376:1540-2232(-)